MGLRQPLKTSRPIQNGHHFEDDIFKRIFLNAYVWILIKKLLKFVPKAPINNIPALVQIMACHRPGDTLLSEPIIVRSPTYIYVTRPQWVNNGLVGIQWGSDNHLKHFGPAKMAAIFRRHFQIHFLQYKVLNSYWNFISILFSSVQLTICQQYCSEIGSAPKRWQAIIWTNHLDIVRTLSDLNLHRRAGWRRHALIQFRTDTFKIFSQYARVIMFTCCMQFN